MTPIQNIKRQFELALMYGLVASFKYEKLKMCSGISWQGQNCFTIRFITSADDYTIDSVIAILNCKYGARVKRIDETCIVATIAEDI
jgi:hypothetical protein